MTMAIFDTLKCSKRLQEAGVSTAHADAEAEILSEAFAVNMQEFATKGDLLATEKKLQHEIKDVRNEIKAVRHDLSHEIKDVRNEIKAVRSDLSHEIKAVRNDLSHQIKDVRNELRHEIKDLRFGLLKWIIGLALAQSSLFSVFKFWPVGLTA